MVDHDDLNWAHIGARAQGQPIACSKCGATHTRSHRWCSTCHAAYMREWRKDHPMSPEQRRRANARSYAKVYVQRGKIERKETCEHCGEAPAEEMHHEDYDKPAEVLFLCKPCHRARHT